MSSVIATDPGTITTIQKSCLLLSGPVCFSDCRLHEIERNKWCLWLPTPNRCKRHRARGPWSEGERWICLAAGSRCTITYNARHTVATKRMKNRISAPSTHLETTNIYGNEFTSLTRYRRYTNPCHVSLPWGGHLWVPNKSPDHDTSGGAAPRSTPAPSSTLMPIVVNSDEISSPAISHTANEHIERRTGKLCREHLLSFLCTFRETGPLLCARGIRQRSFFLW